MGHPLLRLPEALRWPLLSGLILASIAAAALLSMQGQPLATEVPGGILAYEFAWNGARAQEILTAWKDLSATLRQQLWWDFGFMALYPLAFAFACGMLAVHDPSSAAIGSFIACAVLLAAPLDAVENIALLRMLDAAPSDALARLAAVCAGLKFALVLAAFGYLVLGLIGVGVRALAR